MSEKPKCYICGKKGEEVSYLFFNGHLSHTNCVINIHFEVNQRHYDEIPIEKIRGEIVVTDDDRKGFAKNPKFADFLVGKYYSRLKANPKVIRSVILDLLGGEKK